MGKLGPDFDPESYAPVADRIRLFYERYPLGRVETELVSRTERDVVFKAAIFRERDDTLPAATGWAAERQDDGDINAVACLENTETSAVGRALANLGFTASRHRPSSEEMLKSARAHAYRRRPPDPVRHRAEDAPLSPARLRLARSAGEAAPRGRVVEGVPVLADATLDALRLLRVAEASGLPAKHAESLRAKLDRGVSLFSIERLEALLRAAIRAADAASVKAPAL
jgi:hypothetical protein